MTFRKNLRQKQNHKTNENALTLQKEKLSTNIFLSKGTTGKQINFNSIDEILSHLNYQIVINVNIRQTKDSQFRHT